MLIKAGRYWAWFRAERSTMTGQNLGIYWFPEDKDPNEVFQVKVYHRAPDFDAVVIEDEIRRAPAQKKGTCCHVHGDYDFCDYASAPGACL